MMITVTVSDSNLAIDAPRSHLHDVTRRLFRDIKLSDSSVLVWKQS